MQTSAPNGCAEAASSGDNHNFQAQLASSQSEPPRKKGKDKKILSCHSCRRRKLKCDRSDPCVACKARGEGHLCTWEEGQRPEKNNRESLERLPNLILKLTEEVEELKASNLEVIENIRYKEGAVSLEEFPEKLSTAPDITLSLGSECSYQSHGRKRWTQSQIAALLPETSLLRELISHSLHASAWLTGLIDIHRLVSEVEEVEQVCKGMEKCNSPVSFDHFDVKVSLILAWTSLAAVHLDTAKAQELGIAHINIDAFARDLWRKARSLITHLDLSSSTTGFEASLSVLPHAQPSLAKTYADFQQTASASTCASVLPLRVVTTKIVLLLAARSFAASSEYLKLHLDTVSSAVEACLDSPWDNDVSLEEREWRWQLWSFLCVLDWTSPGIYHNGSYFIRPEMHNDPPSKVPGVSDDGTHWPTTEKEHLERLSRNRYFLMHALTLANLSRRVEDCIIRPGPISPAQAAELCSKLDTLGNKLDFYELLCSDVGRGGEANGSNNTVNGSASEGGRDNGSVSSHTLNEHRASFQRVIQEQKAHLGLELGLIRFRLFRHEAFHLMHDATTSGPLRMMCMDACMDACILVLSQCRNIDMGVPLMLKLGVEELQSMVTDLASSASRAKRPCPGTSRRIIQPASSAALIGQVLLHASQSADGLGLLIPHKHTYTSRSMSRPGINLSTSGNSKSAFHSYKERSMETFTPHHIVNGNGGDYWTGRFGREKVKILQWHVDTVITDLEALQATSPLARFKLTLHQQCM